MILAISVIIYALSSRMNDDFYFSAFVTIFISILFYTLYQLWINYANLRRFVSKHKPYVLKIETSLFATPEDLLRIITDSEKYEKRMRCLLQNQNASKLEHPFQKLLLEKTANGVYILESFFNRSIYDRTLYHFSEISIPNVENIPLHVTRSKVLMYAIISNKSHEKKLLCNLETKLELLRVLVNLDPHTFTLSNHYPASIQLMSASQSTRYGPKTEFKWAPDSVKFAQDIGISDSEIEYEVHKIEEPQKTEKSFGRLEKHRLEFELNQYSKEEREYIELGNDKLESYMNVLHNTKWKEIDRRGDFKLLTYNPGNGAELIRSEGYIEFSPKAVSEYLDRDNVQKQFDDNFEKERIVCQYHMGTKIVHVWFKAVWPVQGRDFCLLVKRKELEDGSFVHTCFSVEHEDCPPENNYVRALIFHGGFVIKPVKDSPDRSFCISISHFDPWGNVPKSLVNYMTKSKGSYIRFIADAMKKYW